MSLTHENPLLQHTKARGFLFVVGKLTRGCVGFSDDKDFDKTCPDDSAIIRTDFPTHAAGLCSYFSWLLRRADDAYTGTECKRKEKSRPNGYKSDGLLCA